MGKASRRSRQSASGQRAATPAPAPFVSRPFEGLTGETDWVALREILPAATATVRVAGDAVPEGADGTATIATVLPLAWPGLHRTDGQVLVATQSGSSTGDASRDLAQVLLATLAAEPGSPVTSTPQATAETPRLQDVLDPSAPFEVTVHEGFDFWVEDVADLDEEGRASLERANAVAVPTRPLSGVTSAYWCRIGERTHLRWVLPQDEDRATDALARLHATHDSGLGEGTRLLGAFRACGLLVPVWDLDPTREAADYEGEAAAWLKRYDQALAATEPLTAEERRARSGLLSRQVTLR